MATAASLTAPGGALQAPILTPEVEKIKKDMEGFNSLRVLITVAFLVINILAWADKIPVKGLTISNISLATVFSLASLKFAYLVTQLASTMADEAGKAEDPAVKQKLKDFKSGLMIGAVVTLVALTIIITLNVYCLKGEIPLVGLGKASTIFVLVGGAYQMFRQKPSTAQHS